MSYSTRARSALSYPALTTPMHAAAQYTASPQSSPAQRQATRSTPSASRGRGPAKLARTGKATAHAPETMQIRGL